MPGSFSPGLGDRIEERYELAAQLRVCAVARTFLAVDEYTGQNVALTLFDPACVTATSWATYVKVVAAASAAKVAGLVLPHTVPAALPDSPHVAGDPQIDRGLDRLREQGPLPWQRALTIGERIVEVLAAVHARTAVAHHGLTPARCLVSARDEVKLLDYGVAEFERTRTDDADYRAPGWPAPVADVRPDIHSLAVMLFELICEARPQPGQSLRRLVPVPHAVDELMTRALATDPQRQYADLHDLRTDLRQALGLPPLQPAPPPEEAPPPVTTAAPTIVAREQAPIAAPGWTRLGGSRGATRPELEPTPSSAPRPESTLELRPEPPLKEQTLELQREPPLKEQTLELQRDPPLKESTLELQATSATQPATSQPEPREETVVAPVRTAGKTGAQRSLQTTTGAQRTLQAATGPQRALQTRTGAQRTIPAGATRPTPASDPSAATSGARVAAASTSATNMKVAAAASASATNMKVAAAESTAKPPPARMRSPATSSPSMRVRAVQAAIVEHEDPADADRTVIARRPGAPRQPRLDVTDKLPTDVLDAVNEAHRAQADAPTSDGPPRRPRLDPTDRLSSDVLAAVHDAARPPGPPPTPGPPSLTPAAPPRPGPPTPPEPPSLTPAAPPRPPAPRAAPPPVVRTVVAPPPRPPAVAAPPQPAATSPAPTKPASFEIPAQVAAAVSASAARPASAASASSRSPLTPLKRRLLYLNVGLVTLLLLALVIGLAL
ncbi:MAG: hypothetical protein JNL82_03810 [Myxococcales bacterium]|nr:hypothetical protein [Myxococcales bacterium]